MAGSGQLNGPKETSVLDNLEKQQLGSERPHQTRVYRVAIVRCDSCLYMYAYKERDRERVKTNNKKNCVLDKLADDTFGER